jgi:hypothetical protein
LPLWAVSVLDANPEVRNSDKTVVVKIMDAVRPVPPETMGGTPFRAVEFDGLTVTPYLDDKACSGPKGGERHRCRARMAYSLRATGMHAPSKGSKWSGANEGKAAA